MTRELRCPCHKIVVTLRKNSLSVDPRHSCLLEGSACVCVHLHWTAIFFMTAATAAYTKSDFHQCGGSGSGCKVRFQLLTTALLCPHMRMRSAGVHRIAAAVTAAVSAAFCASSSHS